MSDDDGDEADDREAMMDHSQAANEDPKQWALKWVAQWGQMSVV
jgi:hypothetical protein